MILLLCEDQVAQSDLINTPIKNWAKEKDINISIDNFATAESFLFQWSDYNKYDVIFLDIKMAKMLGIELSNIIREKNKDVEIVFVTVFLICTTWIYSWYITISNKAYKNMGFIFMYTTSDLEKAMIKMSIR